jgi:Na+-driven multidrug efflux pump
LSGIWVAIDMSFLLTMTISFAYYATGRWKKSTVKMANKAEDEPTLTVRGG